MNARINQAVHYGLQTDSWQLVKQISSGYSDAGVYLIAVNHQQYIVKLDVVDGKTSALQRSYDAQRIAAENQIAPNVIYADAKHGILLMQYIPTQPIAPPTAESTKTLAKLIRKLHDGPVFESWMSVKEIVHHCQLQLPETVKKTKLFLACEKLLPKFDPIFNDKLDIKPCHGDLNPGNILFDGQHYFFVDWLCASPQNRYFDLASCANFIFAFNDQLANQLLHDYLGRKPSQTQQDKFIRMRRFADLYFGTMIVTNAIRTGYESSLTDEDFEKLPAFKQIYFAIAKGQLSFAHPEVRFKFGITLLNKATRDF